MAAEGLAGRYELEELIGSGGMAAVYRGFDRRLERRVAVKLLHESFTRDPEMVERFRREARAIAQLNHPNLVSVIDRGEVNGQQFIVLEFVEGETLKQTLHAGQGVSIRRALVLSIEIGRGLAYAHSRGVVHRDVKPDNVLVGKAGAKVTDFGVARANGLDELTLTGTVMGTSYYVSPEQANGGQVDARSDIYSLGIVLYELLTGDVPFHGGSFVEVALHHLRTPVPPLERDCPAASPRLAAAVARSLEKDASERYATMDDFVAELCGCLEDLGDEEQTVVGIAPESTRGRGRSRRPLSVGQRRGLVALVVLAFAVAGLAVWQESGGPRVPGLSQPALAAPVQLRAVAAYDPPPGDGVENDGQLGRATDGNATTYWSTEWYTTQHFGNLKSGVGIVVDAGRAVRLSSLRIVSDTPDYTAVIKAGNTIGGPWSVVSAPEYGARLTTFVLKVSRPERYYLIWITDLAAGTGPHWQAHINEVSAG